MIYGVPSSMKVGLEAEYKFLESGFTLAAHGNRSEPSSFSYGGSNFETGRFGSEGRAPFDKDSSTSG